MGTNFYAQQMPTPEETEKIKQLVSEGNYLELKEYLEDVTKNYHIGKRSGGWQFIFAIQDDGPMPWGDTLEDIKKYLSRDDVKIMDEYGESFTPEQFWNEEVGDSLYNDPEKFIDLDQYYAKHPDLYHRANNNEYTSKEGLRFCTVWFC